ncbi:[FeFe] hydrogenase H-cluster radical SAM maturase HydE [Verrucomicrobiota bacterium]|nr:[FeFe] hydrogenase H-cluster radical SAM maturase HydE [Verrucomicrobiota bacterium]
MRDSMHLSSTIASRSVSLSDSSDRSEHPNALPMRTATGNSPASSLHEQARAMRDDRFGRRVFVRGVVEVSSHCRENCRYCAMRRDNRALTRYRLDADELAELIIHRRPAGITDIDIQAGEDPVAVREVVLPLVRELRRRTNLGITLCLGTLAPREYDQLREAGGDFYVMKIETGNSDHYGFVGAPGNLSERLAAITYLAATGWQVSSGLILGLPGQTPAMVEQTLNLLTLLPLAGCSVSPFVGGPQTPFGAAPAGDIEQTLNCVAWLRLRAPHWIIPAVSAMRLVSEDGYVRAFNAGANLATINLTPSTARANYPIYSRDRVIMDEDRVLTAIAAAGCEVSRIGISEHLRGNKTLANGRVLSPSHVASRAFEAVGVDTCS